MKKHRVIQWGAGYTGLYALQHVLWHPDLELVGLKCFTPEKEGRDAGDIAGSGLKTGIKATQDKAKLLAMDVDCVLYMPRDALADPSVEGSPSQSWIPDLIAILESGKNVVSSIASCTHWRHFANGQAFWDKINAACIKGNSTCFFTGFDPGFTSDALAVALTSVVREIKEIRTWEILDYSNYTVASTMRQMGFGVRPDEMNAAAADNIRICWGGAVHVIGEALGVAVDDVKIEAEGYVSPETFTTPGGIEIKQGTIGAFRFSVIGYVGGKKRFSVNHVTRMGEKMAPDWPRLGRDGGYRIELDAYPPFHGEFPMGLAGGTGSSFDDALATTAARCVNSIDAVVKAEPGYRTLNQLAPIGGRYSFKA